MKLKLSRLWDLSFVLGMGLLAIAATTPHAPLAALLAFNGGVMFCTWVDRFHFDKLHAMCSHLASIADQQETTIRNLKQELRELRR